MTEVTQTCPSCCKGNGSRSVGQGKHCFINHTKFVLHMLESVCIYYW